MFEIIQSKTNKNIFTFQFQEKSKLLIQSFKIITGSTISANYDFITFHAISVHPLSEYLKNNSVLDYDFVLKITYDLSIQLKYLLSKKHTFIGYHPDNIFVLDGNKFVYISNEHLVPINKDNNIIITYPFYTGDFFFSPEWNNIKEIPYAISYKESYYSFAKVILYCLEDDIERIKDTKLYSLLKRCLDKNTILYI